MKKIVLSFYAALLTIFSHGFSQGKQLSPDEITGLYWSPQKDAKIEIYKRGDLYFGRSVWVATPRKDIKNPKESLQKRAVLGIELLTNFSFDNGTYTKGEIYDPDLQLYMLEVYSNIKVITKETLLSKEQIEEVIPDILNEKKIGSSY